MLPLLEPRALICHAATLNTLQVDDNTPPEGVNMNLLDRPTYLLRKRFWSFWGAKVDVFDAYGRSLMFVKQKAFKLRENVRVYTDDTMEEELLFIEARQVIDFAAKYDIEDQTTGEYVGIIRRRGFRSMVRDTWEILDPNEHILAVLEEDHPLLALIRRFLTDLVPQSYSLYLGAEGEDEICRMAQNFNPLIRKLRIYLPASGHPPIDPRLILALAILLILIEGRQ